MSLLGNRNTQSNDASNYFGVLFCYAFLCCLALLVVRLMRNAWPSLGIYFTLVKWTSAVSN
ncbi:MAG: hypothetical protein NTW52_05010 [Planctomycetota bacterium]|nr:hypothetical protein [Planctomycetota bacterium]